MGKKLFLGSTGTAEAFRLNPETKKLDLLFVTKTLTESSVNISITKDDLRAGTGAPVVASFYHDAAVEIKLTDVMFKPEYVEAQLGTRFEVSDGSYQSEKITIDKSANQVTLKKAPLALNIGGGVTSEVVWYTEAGSDNWRSFEGTFEVATGSLPGDETFTGGEYCFRYYAQDDKAHAAEITSNIIPEELYLVITAPLFAGDANSASSGKKAGTIQYEIPRFRLNGGQEFAMAMSSNQTISLSGSALAFDEGCDEDGGKLLRIIEVFSREKWTDNVKDLMIDAESVKQGSIVNVYAVYNDNRVELVDNSQFTFSGATFSEKVPGLITAATGEEKTITVSAKVKPELTATAEVIGA